MPGIIIVSCNFVVPLTNATRVVESSLRAVLNAAIFFQILPPNVWSQEAARIKQPGMIIQKKNTLYSGVLHAIPHYARLKASEVLLLSPRWSS